MAIPVFGNRTIFAVDVSGTAVTLWDGRQETRPTLELRTPGSMRWRDQGNGGQTWSVVLRQGRAYFGSGDAGQRLAGDAVARAGFDVFVLRGQKCRAWSPRHKKWRNAKCRVDRAAEHGESLVIENVFDKPASDNGHVDTAELVFDGDALVSDGLHLQHAIPAATFADARAVVDAYERAHSMPSPKVPVSNMGTPAGLVATMANERTSALYLDHPVTVVGVVSAIGTRSLGLRDSTTIELRDGHGSTGPAIQCATDDAPGAIGQNIAVRGRVAWWSVPWGTIASELVLVDCRVTAR